MVTTLQRHAGRCLCAGVQFRIDGPLAPVQICHCSQCRRAQGTPFATNVPVDVDRFHLVSGSDLLSSFESSPGKHRVFCRRCGSPVYSHRDSLAGVLRIRAGLIDEPADLTLQAHAQVASKATWWSIDGDLPRFDGAIKTPPAATKPER